MLDANTSFKKKKSEFLFLVMLTITEWHTSKETILHCIQLLASCRRRRRRRRRTK
jgi:hypothetical protein